MEFFGLLHQAQSLAIALRHGAAEVVAHAAVEVRALVDGDIGHGTAAERANAGNDGRVLAEAAVAAQVEAVFKQRGNIGRARRTPGVPGLFQAFKSIHFRSSSVQIEQIAQRDRQSAPLDHRVDKAMLAQELRALEIAGQL